MTIKLYYENPYMKNFSAVVKKCSKEKDGFHVILNKTAFYPEGGGQPSDFGTIAGTSVSYVYEKDEEIIHICEKAIEEAKEVFCEILWERRFLFMQQHSGEHIISGIIFRNFGFHNVGFHMNTEEVRIDFDGFLSAEDILTAEKTANDIIFKNYDIKAYYPGHSELKKLNYRSKKELSGDIRIVEIPCADVCACCGLHVLKTGEIGIIKAVSSEAYKGGSRLLLKIGKNAFEDYNIKLLNIHDISAMLSSKPDEAAAAVKKLYAVSQSLKFENHNLKTRIFEYKTKEYEGKEKAIVFEDGLTSDELIRFCDMLILKTSFAAVFSGDDKTGYKYSIGSLSKEVYEESKRLNNALDGKGGGKGNIISGYIKNTKKNILAYFED
ncbi:MAG: alanyl-tRNA editing protein [Lachnospiraceae bacterium]|nr:alanyl-tRNA editing protein [Lachnospiraceae bacterium]